MMLSPAFLGAGASGGFTLNGVFATNLYTGNGATQDIVSGLGFASKGGLAWAKRRDLAQSHLLFDTVQGIGKVLKSDSADASVITNSPTSFNSDGLSLDATANTNAATFVMWQFLKERGFFDIVSYVGDGTSSKVVAHNLNSEVGHIIWKNLDVAANWRNYHRTLTASGSLELNTTAANSGSILPAEPTTSNFTVGNNTSINSNGNNIVAYLFAHNPSKGIFCGSYSGSGVAGNAQDVGFAVGWILIKRTDATRDWIIQDVKRSPSNPREAGLFPNTSGAEVGFPSLNFGATDFSFNSGDADVNGTGASYIYIAIADPVTF